VVQARQMVASVMPDNVTQSDVIAASAMVGARPPIRRFMYAVHWRPTPRYLVYLALLFVSTCCTSVAAPPLLATLSAGACAGAGAYTGDFLSS